MSESNDSTVYQARLVEIFQACDSDSKGYLSLLEFERLCRELQLQPHKHRLYRELGLSRTSGGAKVRFEDFKSVLLSLLHEVGPDTQTADQPPYSLPTDTDGKAADIADRKMNWKPQEQNKNPPSVNADLRLHLPPDMTEDDEEGFDASGDHGDGRGGMSPPSPLKRAYVEICVCALRGSTCGHCGAQEMPASAQVSLVFRFPQTSAAACYQGHEAISPNCD